MKSNAVALVARADGSRVQLAKYLRDGGYDVFECEDLAIPTQFVGVVMVDRMDSEGAVRARVHSWLRLRRLPRIVVISPKPAGWRVLSLAYSDRLYVLAAPALDWDLLDALRSSTPIPPRV